MAESSSRRGVLIGLGALLLVAGLVGAVVLWNVASTRQSNAVADLARAPVGCDTTLDFVETGEYFVFLERSGTIDGVRGDCEVEGSFDVGGSGTPDVEIAIFDPDGEELDLDRVPDDVSYDHDGFVGEAIQTVDIDERNDHVVRVESSDDDAFVVAIGRDPASGVAAIRIGAIAAGVAGLLLGLGLILRGARRAKATVPAGPWAPGQPGVGFPPGGPVPQGPPTFGPQGPPRYQQPPPGYPPQQYPPQQYPPQYPPQPGAPPPGHPAPQYPPQGQPSPPQPPVTPTPPAAPSPFAPTTPHAPTDPAGRAQPIEWSPSAETRPRSAETTPREGSDDTDTGPPDADFIARLQAERDQQQPPPPPA